MRELSINDVERNREIARGREIYARQDVVRREEQEKESFISERADIQMLVKQFHVKYYSRYLENEKPTIEVIA